MSELDDLDQAYEQASTLDVLLPAGEYIARVVDVGIHHSRKGSRGIRVWMRIEEGAHSGKLLRDDMWLTGGALPIAKKNLDALGFEGLKPSSISSFRDFARLPQVRIRVEHEQFEGQTFPTVHSYRRREPKGPSDHAPEVPR